MQPQFKNISSFIAILLTLFISNTLYAKAPTLLITDGDSKVPLSIRNVKADINIEENIAKTSFEITFFNSFDNQLEGQFYIQMPEDANISGFGMYFGETLREAVIVEKQRGRVIFEEVVRRKIDPALLEWSEGNNFSTRVFPIPANGEKTVVISYEEELKSYDGKTTYRLPLDWDITLDSLNINLTVTQQNSIYVNKVNKLTEQLELNKNADNHSWSGTLSKSNINLNEDLLFELASEEVKPRAVMESSSEGNIFQFRYTMDVPVIKNDPSGHLMILWDTSRSMKDGNSDISLKLLRKYMELHKGSTFNCILLGYNYKILVEEPTVVNDESIDSLITSLKEVKYDGATDLSSFFNVLKLFLPKENGTEVLLFSDGLDTVGGNFLSKINSNLKGSKYRINVFSSTSTFDPAALKEIARNTLGQFFNMSRIKNTSEIIKQLENQNFYITSIKTSDNATMIYPKNFDSFTPGQELVLYGKSNDDKSISIDIEYFYDSKLQTKTVEFKPNIIEESSGYIAKLWVRKNLEDMLAHASANKNYIQSLGLKYSIVTPFTSFIVLDTFEDYMQYGLEPPKDLQPEGWVTYEEVRQKVEMIKETDDKNQKDKIIEELQQLHDERKISDKSILLVSQYLYKPELYKEDDKTLNEKFELGKGKKDGELGYGSEDDGDWTDDTEPSTATTEDLNLHDSGFMQDSDASLIAGADEEEGELFREEPTISLDERRATTGGSNSGGSNTQNNRSYIEEDDGADYFYESNTVEDTEPQLITKDELKGKIESGENALSYLEYDSYKDVFECEKPDRPIEDIIIDFGDEELLPSLLNGLLNPDYRIRLDIIALLETYSKRHPEDNSKILIFLVERLDVETNEEVNTQMHLLIGKLKEAGAELPADLFYKDDYTSIKVNNSNGANNIMIHDITYFHYATLGYEDSSEDFSDLKIEIIKNNKPLKDSEVFVIIHNELFKADYDYLSTILMNYDEQMITVKGLHFFNFNKLFVRYSKQENQNIHYQMYTDMDKLFSGNVKFYEAVARCFNAINEPETAMLVLSNTLEFYPSQVPLLRKYAYSLSKWGYDRETLPILRKIADLRGEEPQVYMDLAKAYAKIGDYDNALKYYNEVINGSWDSRFGPIEIIAEDEKMNTIVTALKDPEISDTKKALIKKELKDVPDKDIRIVLMWNQNDTDIDLHVIDPKGEECYYSHKRTRIGGEITDDITQGYGPEVFTLKRAVKGEYKVYVNYFGDNRSTYEHYAQAKIIIYKNYGRDNQTQETYVIDLDNEKERVLVNSFEW